MAAKLNLVPSQPPADLVEEALHRYVLGEMRQFVTELAFARAMFRTHPSLVTSQDWDPLWVEAFMNEAPYHPDAEEAATIPDVQKLRRELLHEAEETALVWAARRSVKHADAAFLQELGITE